MGISNAQARQPGMHSMPHPDEFARFVNWPAVRPNPPGEAAEPDEEQDDAAGDPPLG